MTAEDAAGRLRQARLPQQDEDESLPDGAAAAGDAGSAADESGAGADVTRGPAGGRRVISSVVSRSVRGGLELTGLVRDELRDPLTPVLAFGAVASAVVGSSVDAALVASVMTGNALISGTERMRAERALRQLLLEEQVAARRARWTPPRNARAESAGDPFSGIGEAPVATVPPATWPPGMSSCSAPPMSCPRTPGCCSLMTWRSTSPP